MRTDQLAVRADRLPRGVVPFGAQPDSEDCGLPQPDGVAPGSSVEMRHVREASATACATGPRQAGSDGQPGRPPASSTDAPEPAAWRREAENALAFELLSSGPAGPTAAPGHVAAGPRAGRPAEGCDGSECGGLAPLAARVPSRDARPLCRQPSQQTPAESGRRPPGMRASLTAGSDSLA